MASNKLQSLHRSEEYIFYYRRAIPQLLRPFFNNKWEIKKSLRTRDKHLAVIRHNDLNKDVEELFYRLRGGCIMSDANSELSSILNFKKDTIATYTEGELGAIMSGVIMTLRGKPLQLPSGRVITPAPLSIKGDKLYRVDGQQVPEFFVSHAISHANAMGLPPMINEKPFNLFEGTLEWVDDEPSAETPTKVVPDTKVAQVSVEPVEQTTTDLDGLVPIRFSMMVEDFFLDRPTLKEQTVKTNKAIYAIFQSICGDVLSTDIGHQMVKRYLRSLQNLPSNMSKKYPGKTAKEVLSENVSADKLMSPTTVNKYMSRLAQLFDWAVGNGHMKMNFATGKRNKLTRKDKKEAKKFPFSFEDLDRIFLKAPIHKDNIRDSKNTELFWIPLISLYSGMRVEEICQLQISDVKEIEDDHSGAKAWCFDVNEEGNGKSLKNLQSERMVPIHTELKKMGFMDYYHERRRKGFQTLWNLKLTNRGYSHSLSRKCNRYITNKAGVTETKKTFHSFRHTVIMTLRNILSVKKEYREALVGHELSGTSDQDYFDGLGIIPLKSTVEAIRYPKLDLSHLYQE
jgi:integrase